MKPLIKFEVNEAIESRCMLVGRVTGSNIHVGDIFNSANMVKYGAGDAHKTPIITEMSDDIVFTVLEIEFFRKSVSWIHAPHAAAIRIENDAFYVLSKYISSIDVRDCYIELIGPYSSKSDITGGGRWT